MNRYSIQLVLFLFFLLLVLTCQKFTTSLEHFNEPYNWVTSTPEEQNMDNSLLQNGVTAADELGFVNSLLVIRNGYLVIERYFNQNTRYNAHNIHSVSKSIISSLVGIALENGDLSGLPTKMMDFFPEYDTEELDPRKRNITLEHLLTMKAGFDHDQNVYINIYSSNNWVKTTIDLNLIADPGTEFHYNTFETHLLSAILTKATDQSTRQYADSNLFQILDIHCSTWQQGPDGYYFGGNNMYFTGRDMARFGYLYLNEGNINNKQIIPTEWVEASFQQRAGGTNSWGPISQIGYGYLWWLGKIGNYSIRLALGHAGQIILLVPELNLIVVASSVTLPDWDIADQQERAVLQVIADYIIPAAYE